MEQSDAPRLVLVGAGLQNALIALAVLRARPETELLLLERDARAGGNHTWSFHATDVPPTLAPFADDLAEHRWDGYDVRFPRGERHVPLGYASMSSAHLAQLLEARLAAAPHATLRTGVEVVEVDARSVTLACGERIAADLVIDARGPGTDPVRKAGYQKFYGVELCLDAPHGLTHPLLMDATVEQVDGFRFMYVLPFGPTRLLIEDTVFSTNPDLDAAAWRARVLEEAAARGYDTSNVLREERGVLPMPWAGAGPDAQQHGPLRAGYAGRWFHPATGYSFPQALQLAGVVADVVAENAHDPSALFASSAYRALVKRMRRQTRFARFLNRLLFTGIAPAWRWNVFHRFYRMPDASIARFYRLGLRATDRARMLVGRPPRGFSFRRALIGSAIE